MRKTILFLSFLILFAGSTSTAHKVLYIGDSITDGGWGRSGGSAKPSSERNHTDLNHVYGHGYVWQCAAFYQSRWPDAGWQFWNRGISGNTLPQMADRWQEDALALRPDVISILIGTNDVGTYEANCKKTGKPFTIEGFDYASWERQYRHLLDTTRIVLPNTKLVLCTPFVGKSRGEVRMAVTDSLAQMVQRMAHDYNAVLVPFDSLFASLQQDEPTAKYWIWDGIHPTAAGHLKMAQLWQEKAALTSGYRIPVTAPHEAMQTGQYEPSWESLSQYEVPEWFRDAKFGIWAHWGPQCVEGSGDWMAREMYHEGNRKYKHHREHYGHQSEVGFKDILPLFRAERWQPDSLVAFYKRVGARYFFALGNHHDNFDLWDSQYQPWNSVRIGPKRDLLAGWKAAADKAGLPFGISFHADHAWRWYESAQRSDKEGEYKGIPYDGKLTKADGAGKWWEGLDPQDLYAQNHPLSQDSWDNNSIHRQWDWTHGAVLPTSAYVTNFHDRTLDAINRYAPELIYFDVTVMPFDSISDCGLRIAAHHYNRSMARNGGDNRAVMFGKILNEQQRRAIVWDVERGAPNKAIPEPWQTCTCLGNWHWNEHTSQVNGYKKAPQVIKLLADIVSKNGNLLLSVPLRADGTFDEHERKILEEIGAWMQQNGEAIYATRPWAVFGEGPVAEQDIAMKGQGFNEGAYSQMDSREIRFTQTASHLYAIALGWPEDGKVTIRSLAKGSALFPSKIRQIELLGYGKVNFRRTADGLVVTLPTQPVNGIAPVLKIKK